MSKEITFYEEGHKYLDEKENQLLSVSGLAKLYEPEKDWDKICKRTAKSQGVSFEFLKAKWKDNNEWATKCGTKLHAIKEQELIDNEFSYKGKILDRIVALFQSKEYKKSISQKVKNDSVYPEYLVYSEHYQICGQLDKLIIEDNTIHVYDIKTDKELKRKAYSSEWQAAETFLEPISHLELCNWNEYALKMSVYMYLIWLNNRHLKMGDLVLEHCIMKRDMEGRIEVDENNNPIILEIKEYRLPLLLKEAKLILEHYKNNPTK